ncbi:DUF5820 family protein [Natranaeroarchaeum aerophilus]|uniref:DUF5820 family protein n=1 Tax=Natranaeroarchaeum aerophilus TaxID=2917711 RepID=A0AAE3FTZ6_9EURY|nr:DUF5820 family protein [Natranaeroarchaeum aerophilus]MCL9815085.1 DUF5820 family protein [Natranaeroarchaeum aerophilus]
MSYEQLHEGWVVWNDEPEGRSVLAYRPDVFDADRFPAECLPAIYLTRGRPSRRPAGHDPIESGEQWTVVLYLEPDVDGGAEQFDDRDAAVEYAIELAEDFATGDIDYRGLYQVPRPEYFEKLDELTEA